eukprot:12401648-Karenia_brevis.AAC.1
MSWQCLPASMIAASIDTKSVVNASPMHYMSSWNVVTFNTSALASAHRSGLASQLASAAACVVGLQETGSLVPESHLPRTLLAMR